MSYSYSAWQVGELLVIKIPNMLTFYIPLKVSTEIPDLRAFPVTLLRGIEDVALPVFSLLTCS